MIQAFIEMPIEKQTWLVLSVGWVMLATSAAIREKTPPGECRNWARAMGVVGVLLMSLQTIHTTMIAEELNTELMVRRQQKASEIGEEHVLAVTTQSGNKIEYGVSKNGVRNRTTASRCSGSKSGSGSSPESTGRSKFAAVELGGDGRSHAANDGLDGAAELSRWWGHVWHGPDDGSAVSFRAAGEIEGESF